MDFSKEDFEEIKEESMEKWKNIRETLNDLIKEMGNYCSFCVEYKDEQDQCVDCPAEKPCEFALQKIVPDARYVRDKITALIGRIKRVKQKEN